MPQITYLECSRCKSRLDPSTPQTVCTKCAGALYVRYDLNPAKSIAMRDAIGEAKEDRSWSGMWRYRSVLPSVEPVTLGEGWTPMLRTEPSTSEDDLHGSGRSMPQPTPVGNV
jgi:threonine synthase